MAPLSLITAGTVKMMMMMIIAMIMPSCNIHDGDKEGQGDETITMLMLKQKINMAQKFATVGVQIFGQRGS